MRTGRARNTERERDTERERERQRERDRHRERERERSRGTLFCRWNQPQWDSVMQKQANRLPSYEHQLVIHSIATTTKKAIGL